MVSPTWEDRDLPVLQAAVAYCEEHNGYAEARYLCGTTGFDERAIKKAFDALLDETPKLFVGYMRPVIGPAYRVSRPTGEARRIVGLWPSHESLADRLVEALTKAAERESDEERRGWLRKTATWFGGAGRDVAVNVIAALITGGGEGS